MCINQIKTKAFMSAAPLCVCFLLCNFPCVIPRAHDSPPVLSMLIFPSGAAVSKLCFLSSVVGYMRETLHFVRDPHPG